MTYLDESLTNDQKIRLMDMAICASHCDGYEAVYKRMIDLITNHKEKGILTINIQGDIMNSETFIDAFVKRLNEEMKK